MATVGMATVEVIAVVVGQHRPLIKAICDSTGEIELNIGDVRIQNYDVTSSEILIDNATAFRPNYDFKNTNCEDCFLTISEKHSMFKLIGKGIFTQ